MLFFLQNYSFLTEYLCEAEHKKAPELPGRMDSNENHCLSLTKYFFIRQVMVKAGHISFELSGRVLI